MPKAEDNDSDTFFRKLNLIIPRDTMTHVWYYDKSVLSSNVDDVGYLYFWNLESFPDVLQQKVKL